LDDNSVGGTVASICLYSDWVFRLRLQSAPGVVCGEVDFNSWCLQGQLGTTGVAGAIYNDGREARIGHHPEVFSVDAVGDYQIRA
jgi:hypothetical protein